MTNRSAARRIDTGSSILEEKIARYALVPHYVLITGERGTGKTTIARRLHELSPRSKRSFVSVNCASLTSDLLESELFGYEKGAFTGAVSAKAGLFETSGGGTLFLDEIGELTPGLQAKLLKAVEERRIRRGGGTYEREIDVRIIAATSRDLTAMVRDSLFRPDLLDRLNVLSLETIPLRSQREKIRHLFLSRMEEERFAVGRDSAFLIDEAALSELERFQWKGNYRELRNFAARLAVESMNAPTITVEMIRMILPPDSLPGPNGAALCLSGTDSTNDAGMDDLNPDLVTVILDMASDDLNSVYLKAAATLIEHKLNESNGSLRLAARSLKTTHSTLSRILTKHRERSQNSRIPSPQISEYQAMAYSAAA